MSKEKNFVRVIFDLPVDREFHYLIPQKLKDKLAVGQRVLVPFGKKTLSGFIIGFTAKPAILKTKIKEVLQVLDLEPLVDEDMLRLTHWLSQYYFCSWGKALFEAVPAAVKKGKPKRQKISLASLPLEMASSPVIPNRAQGQAIDLINRILNKKKFEVILLFGLAKSGKTEVCIQGIDYCLKQGRQALVLVPEISKTSPITERFIQRYGSQVGVLHSKLPRLRHYEEWQRIKRGEVNIVIGTRSAVFSPLKNLGMIVIDDEHERSYKQSDDPKYHAREVAIERARRHQALVILSSATPSLETFYQVKTKKFKMAVLPERIDRITSPEVEIVDMRKENSNHKILSEPLEKAIKERLEKKEQIILFLNRRGFATSLLCRQCSFVLRCPNCSLPLVFHQEEKLARCHYCNYKETVPAVCPQCYSSYIRYLGLGTQKVEEIINQNFSGRRVIRIDSDSLRRKKAASQILLKAFAMGEGDFLIGTQMVTKDWDFPKVTLAGVISADVALNLPDFRAGERTFQQLNQIANLVKGGENGKVIIQTLNPEHSSIQDIKKHDYLAFYGQELKFRKELGYPPFSHLANITLRGKSRVKVEKYSYRIFTRLKQAKKSKLVEISEPVTPPYSRIKGKFHQEISLKTGPVKDLQSLLRKALKGFSVGRGINLSVEIDPIR